jgi:hypothetical protein
VLIGVWWQGLGNILTLAKAQPEDVYFDLGSGTGLTVIQARQAQHYPIPSPLPVPRLLCNLGCVKPSASN